MKTKGYSLWLMPNGHASRVLSGLIRKMSAKFATPSFEPHITLLGEVAMPEAEVMQRTQQLAKKQKPLTIILQSGVQIGDSYFNALYMKVKVTQSLMELHLRAKEIFEIELPLYTPHLSLLYGDFPALVKDEMKRDINRDYCIRFVASGIHLFNTVGEVTAWQKRKEFRFIV